MNMQLFWEIMFFISPLIAGGIVALSRPVGVIRYLGRFHNWLWFSSNKQGQAAGKRGFFRKYIVRPINGSLLSMAEWTQGIENEFIRCGVRIASYTYFLALFFALLAFAVYVVVSVVIIVAMVIFIFWLFWFVLVPMIFKAMNNGAPGSHEQDDSGSVRRDTRRAAISGDEKMKAYEAGQAHAKKFGEAGIAGQVFAVIERDDRTSVFRSDGDNAEIKKAFESGEKNYNDSK